MKKNYVILALFCLGMAGGFGYGAGQASKDEIVPEPTRVKQNHPLKINSRKKHHKRVRTLKKRIRRHADRTYRKPQHMQHLL